MDTPSTIRDSRLTSSRNFRLTTWTAFALIFLWVIAGLTIPSLPGWSYLVLLVIVLYGVAARINEWGNPPLLAKYAESAYFMGYLSTIAGLVVIVVAQKNITNLQQDDLIRLLRNGATTVFSTVAGLTVMFVLRVRVQALELSGTAQAEHTPHEPTLPSASESMTRQMDEAVKTFQTKMNEMSTAIDSFREKIAASQVDTLEQVSQAASSLRTNMDGFGSRLHESLDDIKAFRDIAASAGAALTTVRSEVVTLGTAAQELRALPPEILPSWKEVAASLRETAALLQEVTKASAAATVFSETVKASTTALQTNQSSVNALGLEVTAALGALRTKLSSVSDLSGAVSRFVELANKVSPTMEVLGRTFADITQINQNVKDVTANMRLFNDQLNKASDTTTSMAAAADKLMTNADKLVEELTNKVFSLQKLTKPVEDFGQMAEKLAPAVGQLKPAVEHMQALKNAAIELNNALADLKATTGESNDSMRQTSEVVGNLIEITRRIVDEPSNTARP